MKILLDMDGVLVDFISGLATHLGQDPEAVYGNLSAIYETLDVEQYGRWSALHRAFGFDGPEGIWNIIDLAGAQFWINLPEHSWADQLWDWCHTVADDVIIASAPSADPQSLAGKVAWLQERRGKQYWKYILGYHKEMMANRNHVLIDDSDRNVDEFMDAGGRAILFPRPWNSNHKLSDDPITYVKMCWQEIQDTP